MKNDCEGCCDCSVPGVREGNDNGHEVPSGWQGIERCDTCERYADDVDAAIAYCRHHKLAQVRLLLDTVTWEKRAMGTELQYRTNNGGDWVVLVTDGLVRSDWGVTPDVLREFCDCSDDAADWDDRYGDEHKPDEYGTLVAVRRGYTLEAIDEVRWAERVTFMVR